MGLMPESNEDITIFGCVAAASVLGVLGAVGQIALICVHRRHRKRYWRLVLGLAFANFTFQLVTIMGVAYMVLDRRVDNAGCVLQGFVLQWLSNVPLCYVVALSLLLYWIVVHQQKLSYGSEFFYHLSAWVMCPAVALIPLFHLGGTSYTDIGGWCWLAEDPIWAPMALSTAWLWVVMGLVFIIYTILLLRIRIERKRLYEVAMFETSKGPIHYRRMVEIRWHLVLYPVAFVILCTPAVIDSTLKAANVYWFPISLLHYCLLPLQGFVNFFIYFFTTGMHKIVAWRLCDDDHYRYSRIRFSIDSSQELSTGTIIE